jgi:nitric oxide dioxygenase
MLKLHLPRLAPEHRYAGDKLGEDYDVAGRLDLSTIDRALLPENADYYLCGPMPFMAEQHKALVARGIPAENIHSEAFGTGGVRH